MKRFFAQLCAAIGLFSGMLAAMPMPVAASLNPDTGDPTTRIMGWVFIALGVSLITIIVLFIVLGKNRRD